MLAGCLTFFRSGHKYCACAHDCFWKAIKIAVVDSSAINGCANGHDLWHEPLGPRLNVGQVAADPFTEPIYIQRVVRTQEMCVRSCLGIHLEDKIVSLPAFQIHVLAMASC